MRAEFTKATKFAAFQRANGRCENPDCGTRLYVGKFEYHHDRECAFGGAADLDNCVVLCVGCHRAITNKQASVIAKTTRVRNRHIGIRKSGRTIPGRRFNGTPIPARWRA